MKYLSLLLVISVVLCYTGLGATVCHSYDVMPNMANCHTNHKNEFSDAKTIANSYKNTDTTNHERSMCQDALPTNAPHGYIIKNIISYSLAIDVPTLEVDNISSFPLNLTLKTKYRPPDLFLANSSFLL